MSRASAELLGSLEGWVVCGVSHGPVEVRVAKSIAAIDRKSTDLCGGVRYHSYGEVLRRFAPMKLRNEYDWPVVELRLHMRRRTGLGITQM